MKRACHIAALILALAFSTFATTYYASTTGSGTTCSQGSPCTAQYGLSTAGPVDDSAGHTLCLTPGTYPGRFTSTLTQGIVRSCDTSGNPLYDWLGGSGWAIFDGYATTTLNGGIDSTTCSITFTSVAAFTLPQDIYVDSEYIRIYALTGNTSTSCDRHFNGTSAASHSNGATLMLLSSNTLTISGADTTYRDFEVMNSFTDRGESIAVPDWKRGTGVGITGDGNAIINLLIHDNVNGATGTSGANNNTWYGNTVYNNGNAKDSSYSDGASGGSMYMGNASGYNRIYNNIALNGFNYNFQFGDYVGGDHRRNVVANAGAPLGGMGLTGGANARKFNALYHHENPAANITGGLGIIDSFFWQPDAAVGGYVIGLGYNPNDKTIDTMTVTGNKILGGEFTVRFGPTILTATFSNNEVDGPNFSYINKPATMTWTACDNNTYHNASGKLVFFNGATDLNFANWKSATGCDANSTQTASVMPDFAKVVPNTNQTGRCTIVVMAKSTPTSINVNLNNGADSCGLTNGQAYTIINNFDPKDTAVATGTYNSGSTTISVPLNGAAMNVATPIGMGFTPATTCPQLCVMELMPGAITEEQNTVRLVWTRIAAIIPPFFIIAAAVLAIAFGVAGLVFFIDRRQQARRFAAHTQPKYITAPVDSFINDFHRDFDKARRKK